VLHPKREGYLSVAVWTEEEDFWIRLEFRVCREIEKMPVFRRQQLWCDGFIPESYLLDRSPRLIIGSVWIGKGGSHQEPWTFRLFLPSSSLSTSHVAWSELLPQEEATGWLGVNATKKELKVDLRRHTTA
jgi:hypothetical protein